MTLPISPSFIPRLGGVADERKQLDLQMIADPGTGKGFFPFYRIYGLLKAFNDKAWKPDEIKLVK